MSIKIYENGQNSTEKITANFTVGEFACNDGTDKVLIDIEGVEKLQQVRDLFGRSITLNSAYRTQAYNQQVGGATNSYHIKGQAFDTRCGDISVTLLAKAYQVAGFGGTITYKTSNFVHADTRTSTYYADIDGGNIGTNLSTISSGAKGQEVEDLQYMLNFREGESLVVDGAFGALTKAAVTKFQTENSLTVDGICGKATWTALLTAK